MGFYLTPLTINMPALNASYILSRGSIRKPLFFYHKAFRSFGGYVILGICCFLQQLFSRNEPTFFFHYSRKFLVFLWRIYSKLQEIFMTEIVYISNSFDIFSWYY